MKDRLVQSPLFWNFSLCAVIVAWLVLLSFLARFVVSVLDEPLFWLTAIPVFVASTCVYAALRRAGQIEEAMRQQARKDGHDVNF